ncbi:hypothetical protein [Neptunicoccus cionae]|uniref:Uncharacterized protein n=1 Tax=Neptunicoccus cionae TaxID=2035344 RepID=A0A916QWQ5_9RHOB|nr:hypothetical protein [Amylibacter cionae]GGA16572.1 hypothetical protein GCM10011498_16330 [Amylibacter cionae]
MGYTSFFKYMADRHLEGHDALVSRNFVFPLPIFVKDKVSVIKTEQAFRVLLAEYRATLELAGLVRTDTRQILAQRQQPDGISIAVEKQYYDINDVVCGSCQVTYFATVENDRLRFHMVEYTDIKAPMPLDQISIFKAA